MSRKPIDDTTPLAVSPAEHWRQVRQQARSALSDLMQQIRYSDDPEADAALADLQPMLRLLDREACDLGSLRAVERHWRCDAAWQDLQALAPEVFTPLQASLQRLQESLQQPWPAADRSTAGHLPDAAAVGVTAGPGAPAS